MKNEETICEDCGSPDGTFRTCPISERHGKDLKEAPLCDSCFEDREDEAIEQFGRL